MFDRIKRVFQKQTPKEDWKETLRRLGKELVPLFGEAETLQGELVRCVQNLNGEAKRNGWMNWDEGDVESVGVLRRYLPDPDVFSEAVICQVHKALDTVRYAGERGADEGVFAYEELTFLAQRVVEWCGHCKELEYKNPDATWLDEDPFQETRSGQSGRRGDFSSRLPHHLASGSAPGGSGYLMNNTQESEGTARREPGVSGAFTRRLFCWQRLGRVVFMAASLAMLVALFYAVEDWRGRRAWEKCRRELEAKGEVIDWNAFIPAPVSDEQNIYKAPKMTEWFVKGSFTEAFSSASSKPGKAETPFQLAPRQKAEAGSVLVAEVQVVTSKEPLPDGKADAVLRFDDPAASEQAARLIRGHIGPCAECTFRTWCLIASRLLDRAHPLYLVVQADKVPSAKALAEFLPRSPVPHNSPYADPPEFLQVEGAGSSGFLVSLEPPTYTAAEYLDLSQLAVADLDVLRKALERPLARMDGDYQRPYDHPVPNFVRLRTVVQMLSQRAQCYLLLGQPEAAWHELALVRDTCHMLEAKPASDCPTLVEGRLAVAFSGLYVFVVQDGLRLGVWREPELAAMQKQLGEINLVPLLYRCFQAERAATCRTFETYTPAEIKKLFALGNEKHGFWDKLKDPTFLFLTFGPRGWLFQNLVPPGPHEQTILGAFDVPNNQILPGRVEIFDTEVTARKIHRSPYTYLATLAHPNFLKTTQMMAFIQTLANEAYIACGLERCRLAHKQYPKTLAELVPQFAEKLPHDIIGGEPLKYERTADDRFELYSIGWNAKNGHGFPGETIAEGDWVWE